MKIPAEITAYYPSDEGVEGGYYDALGNILNPNYNTCACPKEIPFHTKIRISGTGTKYDSQVYECLDRGSAIVLDNDGVYHIDLLMHNKEEANTFGRRKNAYIEILEEGDDMKTGYGFIEFENISEFKTWLAKQKVTRTVTRLQVHHMWLPDYSCWGKDNALRRQYNTKDYHINHNHWGDIAQHFSIFPDGHIVTGRNLNKTPIGIRGWNTNAICVEIYGNFDKGHDKMTDVQKQAVIAFYGELCKKFKLTPSVSTVRPHCWFTAGGTYLGDYNASKSAKTCPGTNFMGIGNTKKAFVDKFYPMIKDYMNGEKSKAEAFDTFKQYIAKPITDELNCRKGPGTEYDVECTINTDTSITVVDEAKARDGGTWLKCKAGYFVNKKYMEFVRYV